MHHVRLHHDHVRLLTIMLWVASTVCLVGGTFMGEGGHHSVMSSHWGLYFSAAAAAGTVWVTMERVVRVVSRRNAEDTANAVGEAVGRVLREHDRI